MSAPLYLIDGSGYIFRAFYAIAPLSNKNGLPTNALFGFTRMLLKLMRDAKVEKIAVAFDMAAPTFRHKMYESYKANRREAPVELIQQMPHFRTIVKALNITILEKEGFEADDLIATLSIKHVSPNHRVIVVSGDKDLTQLIADGVEVYEPMRDIHYTEALVKEKFGVMPAQIGDYLALTGDSSDNIPGVAGVGPKTAAQLIEEFGTLDAMLADLTRISSVAGLRGAAGVQKKIEASLDKLTISRTLVTLDSKVEPFYTESKPEDFHWQGADFAALDEVFREYGFSNLVETVPGASNYRTATNVTATPVQDYRLVSEVELPALAETLRTAGAFAFDTETTGLDTLTAGLVGISVSWAARTARFIPLVPLDEGKIPAVSLEACQQILGPVFADPAIKKLVANGKFDLGVLVEHGMDVQGIHFDCMLASYVLNPDRRQHGLKALAKNHLDEEMVSFEDMLSGNQDILAVPSADLTKYACHDADATFRLQPVLTALCEEQGPTLHTALYSIEMPLVPILSQIERTGVKVDVAFLSELQDLFSGELANFERDIYEAAGTEFNINSPKQLGSILFEHLGIDSKGVKKTTHGYSTDASVLEKLRGQHPIIPLLLDYREVFKLKTTYIDSLQRLVHPKTGRIHTSFNQAVAATGRLSSSDPNLQNIPIRNERGRRIRRAFIAEPNYRLISADYSQIELRILAQLSGDENLRQAFMQGADIHMVTAREIFGGLATSDAELKDLRRVAKTINFGVIYGMGAFRLADQLGISRAQAQKYIDEYFARYPRVKGYFQQLEEHAKTLGYVETMFGHRRYLRDIDTSGRDAGYATRSLLNAPIQGTAAEIIKLAMVRLAKALEQAAVRASDGVPAGKSARLVLQVHDELVIEAPEEIVLQTVEIVRTEMERAVQLDVPLKVDVVVGESWGKD